ncbi:Lrp/AsnC family transcriptional regulator [Archaeoglobus neptunius]|uniref:Lrp/AsnC family transcriptional regulator n=1 Tax=Archaeoglobus neptunius TaxID=2798580 RepID=UPI00192605DD|nr:Lrp/AsnC family transcriptional regulator [Archaeoglobus neptunius]
MTKIIDIDEKDRMILELLEKDPEMSQSEIAKVVGLSQPSVGSRIKKLKELGVISHAYGLNIKKSGLYVLKVDVKCKKPSEILSKLSKCPFFLNGFIVAGDKNLTLFLSGEDLTTLEAIVDKHIRAEPEVYNVEAGIIVRSEKDAVMPVKMYIEKSRNVPCGEEVNCTTCEYWRIDLCLGCPVTGHYKGKIWK